MADGAGSGSTPDKTHRTACSYCGVGCGIEVTTRVDDGRTVIARVSGDKLHPTNFGRLCTKGAMHAEMMAADDDRLTTALLRPTRGDELVPAPVDDAVAEAGRRLRAIIDAHGPDAVALYVSGQMTLEAQYLATKLAKGFLRTVHIESNSRLCMASAGTGFKQSLGSDGPPGSYTDFDRTDLFFVTGANMADCHPILFLRMADRLKAGAKLIVVDPRRTATAERADLFLQIKPGTDLALLNGLLHLLVQTGAIDHEFIAEHTTGWEAMPDFLADYPPDRVAEITGIPEADIRTAAAMIAEAGEWMSCWTMGLNQSTHGTWNTNAICNLHLATGAICRPGSGPMSLTGQPNAMGGREMGYMGPGLPGQRSVLAADDRAFVETRWGLEPDTIRTEVGPGTIGMFEQMEQGHIKACWIICTNPVASVANRKTVINGLEAAELVVVQDAYRSTATNHYADILLPAALWAEAEGVMVNSERNLTLLSPSVAPAGQARPDWQLICQVATQLGFAEHFDYRSAEEIFDEIREFANPKTGYDLRGADYARLRETPLQWPVPPGDGPGGADDRHPIRYLNDGVSQDLFVDADGRRPRLAFATPSRRAVFHARPHMDAAELPDDDYPMVLNTGRLQHQWHTMTKTGKVGKLNKLNPTPFVEIHPMDALELDIVEGQQVELASRRGRAVLPAKVSDRVRPGNCFAPFHWNDEHGEYLTVNAVTNDAVDSDSLQPEFKVCAVSLRPVRSVDGTSALHPLAAEAGLAAVARPMLSHDEKIYLAGFFTALPDAPVGVPVLPASAPLSATVRLWVDGVLAGRYSRAGDSEPGRRPVPGGPMVLWASQTGTAEEFAAGLAGRIDGASLVNMDDLALADLAAARDVLVVTSTFGDGGPPDNGADFWNRLQGPDAPQLHGLRYAVLGIGDKSYDNFCGHAKSLDQRLADLGATKLLERADCEAYDDEPMRRWADAVTTALTGATPLPAALGSGIRTVIPTEPDEFTRAKPILAVLGRNERLTAPTAAKEVRQFGFDISEYEVSYSVGDSLGVYACNDPAVVDAWLAATALCADSVIEVDGVEQSLRDALISSYDICRVTPDLLRFVADACPDRSAAKILRNSGERRGNWLRNRNGLDVVTEFAVRAEPEQWQEVLVRLTPRNYSISSSPLVSPHEVQTTVSVLRYRGPGGVHRGGVCSTFLADRAAAAPVFLQRSPHFRPPEDADTPMIMIGPGTGIAPFRGFLQERRALGHRGRNWLFFGDQHRDENFYYRDEFEEMAADGFLSRLDLAFSRDQANRVYVQHKMIERGAEVWRWLDEGAHLYVCGDAARMAKDVDATLTTILRTHGGMSDDAARGYKRDLVAQKRYVRDVY
ncbi:molybdopterin oxidoreductase [Mycolicibacterium conceptionense]|jgi:sulfite reductase (NADPH) flavoprotein alpha-component|uniref:Molybdopterin oxidoreductase n=2 Tax=Mycolicibacterium TaxID=1866885 RepID=A0ABR5FNL5_9MYCO|nr:MULTISPECIES: bifunctional nitrate reductase/sulfite reductase flavoprotein subunit alpha [Mycolicibacterium]KLI08695.1 molybdopterin oxidoreductase [Mycolicibacterium senegalense]KLO48387.1 molybdopterin oxidoreductase [Mycolicibacterium senegalense]KMV20439.1 molybdopterin oxidoreductase [Mycolicibacterium conceptionense]OBJ93849.1 molybdopterin oxidoreductase [Mycolicibacterium conceptionense]OMB88029.1 molybdopterin oxidoreductase [Mycolicibacterium conceptionense]